MYNLTDMDDIKKLMKKHRVTFSKRLGQNFIVDPTICPEMVELSNINDDYCVIEIGVGVGVLTKELAKRARKVIAIEIDERLIPLVNESLSEFDNITLINDDVLNLDLNQVIEEHSEGLKVCVCANLPYYITSPIIMYLLENNLNIDFITAMVQKEAGDRLCAEVGSRASGAITVGVNYFSSANVLFDVNRTSFMPSPKVDSSVVQFTVKKEKDFDIFNEKKFFKVVKACFCQRRKTILNSISHGLQIDKEIVKNALNECGVDEGLRAEKLLLKDFDTISRQLSEHIEG